MKWSTAVPIPVVANNDRAPSFPQAVAAAAAPKLSLSLLGSGQLGLQEVDDFGNRPEKLGRYHLINLDGLVKRASQCFVLDHRDPVLLGDFARS